MAAMPSPMSFVPSTYRASRINKSASNPSPRMDNPIKNIGPIFLYLSSPKGQALLFTYVQRCFTPETSSWKGKIYRWKREFYPYRLFGISKPVDLRFEDIPVSIFGIKIL